MRPASPIVLALTFAIAGVRVLAQPAVSAQEHAEKALQFAQRGDLKSAESELRTAVKLSSDDPNLLTSLGGILGMEGNLREANTFLARAVQLNPTDPAPRRNLAANEWQLGRLKEAHQNLDLLLRANPHDKIAIFLSGMVAQKEKAYARGAELLESVPDVIAHQPDGWVALADSYYHTDRAEGARAALQHLLDTASNPRTVLLGGRVAADAKDFSTAEELFQAVRSTYPDRARVELEIARAEYQGGHVSESEKTLLDAVHANQASSEAYVLLCTMLSDRGENLRALEMAAQGARSFPGSSDVLSVKGSIELQLQYFNDAAASYEKAAKLQDSADAWRGLGTAQWRVGMHERAAATFDQAIRRFPRDARTYQVFGALLLDDGSPESRRRAVDLFERALALNEAAVEPRYQLANLELEDGKAEQARANLEKAIQLAPQDSRLHFALSRVYRRLGREADASKEAEIYQKLKAAEQPGARNDSAGGAHP